MLRLRAVPRSRLQDPAAALSTCSDVCRVLRASGAAPPLLLRRIALHLEDLHLSHVGSATRWAERETRSGAEALVHHGSEAHGHRHQRGSGKVGAERRTVKAPHAPRRKSQNPTR